MSRQTEHLRNELKALDNYKDGSYYMGGMAQSKAFSIMGAKYGYNEWNKVIDEASDHEIYEAAKYLESYLKHMRANPMKKCPCCGQIVRA